jgi:hypothetical protein
MRKTLLGMYHDLKESGGTSDFPNLLGNTMYKTLLSGFNGFPSPWRQYVTIGNLADFKAHDRIILSGAPDLLKVEDGGPYKDSKIKDYKYSIKADTFGRTFSVGRHAIINDDLGGILSWPKLFGPAAVRTMVKLILGLLKGGIDTCYDGSVLFTVAHANYIANTALANTAAGMAAVSSCKQKIALQTDPDTGELMGLRAKYLLTGTTLAPVARQLIKSAQILPASTNGGGMYNEIADLIPIEEPLIDSTISTTFWAVIADPAIAPVIEVGFLNGKETPDLLVMKPTMANLAGGDDPYDFEFDEMTYKVRHDWAVKLAYYQGICRGYS